MKSCLSDVITFVIGMFALCVTGSICILSMATMITGANVGTPEFEAEADFALQEINDVAECDHHILQDQDRFTTGGGGGDEIMICRENPTVWAVTNCDTETGVCESYPTRYGGTYYDLVKTLKDQGYNLVERKYPVAHGQ